MRLNQTHFIRHVLILVALLSIGFTAYAQDSGDGLFGEPGFAADATPLVQKTGTVRTRAVTIDFNKLQAGAAADGSVSYPQTLTLNLFSDVSIQATLRYTEARPSGAAGYMWVGDVVGEAMADVILTVDPNGSISGMVLMPGYTYDILPGNGGAYTIAEIDADAVGSLLKNDGIIPSGPEPESYLSPQDASVSASPDDGSVIDVMIVYTQDVENQYGGFNNYQSEMDALFTSVNAGYQASNVNQRISLVHLYKTSFDESPSGDLATYLYYITYTQGNALDPSGIMDDVKNVRNQYNADLVALMVQAAGCGIGWLPQPNRNTTAERGYSVTDIDCISGYTFQHELGHNMGAAHNVEDAGSGGPFSYGYGYRDVGFFRTVMAYPCSPTACPRVNRWSDPSNTYNGRTTGTANTDNQRVLNETAIEIANYRQGGVPIVKLTSPTGNTPVTANINLKFNQVDGAGYYILDVYPPNTAKTRYVRGTPICSAGVCTLTIPSQNKSGEWNVWITAAKDGAFSEWAVSKFNLGLGSVNLTSPTGTVAGAANTTLTFPRQGAGYVVVDAYPPGGGAKIRNVVDMPNCGPSTCSVNVPTNYRMGVWNVWVVGGAGGQWGPWALSKFTMVPGTASYVSSSASIVGGNTLQMTVIKPTGSAFAVVDVYAPNGTKARDVVDENNGCSGNTCTVQVPFAGLAGTYEVWGIAGAGTYYGPWAKLVTLTASDSADSDLPLLIDTVEIDVAGAEAEPPVLDIAPIEAPVDPPDFE